MSLFKPATNTQAYLKAGIMGFAGTGKTYTAKEIAIGMIELMRKTGLEQGNKPVMFLDTETGSDWVKPFFDDAEIELFVAKTRAFKDLLDAVNEAENSGSVLLIDSISHFWRELTESYAKRKNRRQGLQFQDWAWLKQQWGRFTDQFVNSSVHIIMCGRAGYEYDFFQEDGGKRELMKTGIKMKAETETGYEPSILVLMEKAMDLDGKTVYREAHILKDRSTKIDGRTFRNPTFNDFLPHIEFLNLGGQQLGVDTERNSEDMIPKGEKSAWQHEREQSEIVLDEITELMKKFYPGQSADDKKARGDLLETYLDSRSWKRISETYSLAQLRSGYNAMHLELEKKPSRYEVPAEAVA